jgi:hypothetical protein
MCLFLRARTIISADRTGASIRAGANSSPLRDDAHLRPGFPGAASTANSVRPRSGRRIFSTGSQTSFPWKDVAVDDQDNRDKDGDGAH